MLGVAERALPPFGQKDGHHPVVGDLHLSFEAMELPADPGLSLVVYGARPGSPSDDGLRLWLPGQPLWVTMQPRRTPNPYAWFPGSVTAAGGRASWRKPARTVRTITV